MKHQGDTAELLFMIMNHRLGYTVLKPFGDNAKYDIVVDIGKELQRIQVKSTSRKATDNRMDCYNCVVCSGAKNKQPYSKKDIDYIAIYVIPEDVWYKIPIEEVKGKTVKLYPHREPQRDTYEKYRL